MECETIRERTRSGLHRAFRNGKHSGRIPYGYKLAPDESTLEVVEEEARIVREIVANIATGSTLYRECKRLNESVVPSPGWRFKGGERKYGASWSSTTVAAIIHQPAYSGTHQVKIDGGETLISREVPTIVEGSLQERARATLAENKRYPNRKNDRKYLLRGLIRCEVCGFACTGRTSTSHGKKYSYYGCISNRAERGSVTHPSRILPHRAPSVRAPWLEDLVWQDLKRFLESPRETLERVREQLANADGTGELEARYTDLTKRLATKQAEKDRYIRLYAQDHISEEELETYLLDLKNQVGNLRLLIESVEADLSRSAEHTLTAKSVRFPRPHRPRGTAATRHRGLHPGDSCTVQPATPAHQVFRGSALLPQEVRREEDPGRVFDQAQGPDRPGDDKQRAGLGGQGDAATGACLRLAASRHSPQALGRDGR